MPTYKEAADALAAAVESGNAGHGESAMALYNAAVAENEVEGDYDPDAEEPSTDADGEGSPEA